VAYPKPIHPEKTQAPVVVIDHVDPPSPNKENRCSSLQRSPTTS